MFASSCTGKFMSSIAATTAGVIFLPYYQNPASMGVWCRLMIRGSHVFSAKLGLLRDPKLMSWAASGVVGPSSVKTAITVGTNQIILWVSLYNLLIYTHSIGSFSLKNPTDKTFELRQISQFEKNAVDRARVQMCVQEKFWNPTTIWVWIMAVSEAEGPAGRDQNLGHKTSSGKGRWPHDIWTTVRCRQVLSPVVISVDECKTLMGKCLVKGYDIYIPRVSVPAHMVFTPIELVFLLCKFFSFTFYSWALWYLFLKMNTFNIMLASLVYFRNRGLKNCIMV